MSSEPSGNGRRTIPVNTVSSITRRTALVAASEGVSSGVRKAHRILVRVDGRERTAALGISLPRSVSSVDFQWCAEKKMEGAPRG